jgi:hypothetical protein
MELYNEEIQRLTVTPALKEQFIQTAKWAKIIVITAWAGSVLSMVFDAGSGEWGAFAAGFFSLGISVAIYIYLLKFGNEIKKGVNSNDPQLFNTGLFSLRTYFKIVSLLLIIILGICLLIFLFVIVFAVLRK